MTRPAAEPLTVVLDGSCADPSVLGGKGAALDRLIGWGVRVPATGVVTASTYRAVAGCRGPTALLDRLLADEPCTTVEIDRAFRQVQLPPAIRAALVDLGGRIGAGDRVAVRSSATVEDLAASSFAGLYRSVLDVDPADPDGFVTAVLSVFASLWHPQAVAYRRTFGVDDDDVAMAVVVMRMVPAERAGVTFTVDPADDSGRVRVESVEGLADGLVSGRMTPTAWLLDARDDHPEVPPEVQAALAESCRIASLSGCPQDVEWAWADRTLWIVQARPITTVGPDDAGDGFDSPDTDDDLTTAGIGEMLPGVLPPLLWQLNAHLVDEAFRTVLDGLGLGLDDDDRQGLLRRVRGRATLDFSRLHRAATQLPGGGAEELERQYFGSRRTGRPVAPAEPGVGRLAAARHDLRVLVQQHRNNVDAGVVQAAVVDLRRRRPDLGGLDDDALLRYRFRLVDLAVRAMTAELASAAAAAAAYRHLELTLAAHLGAEDAGRFAGSVTSQRGVVAVPCDHASAAVFAGPTWEEIGQDVAAPRARDDEGDPLDELRARLETLARFDADAPLRWFRRQRIDRAVEGAVEHLRRREHTKAAVLELGGEVRRVHLELGDRLVARTLLEDRADIDLLSWDESVAALRGAGPPLRVIARRRRWQRRYQAEGPLPVRFRGRPAAQAPTLPPGNRIEGWAASAGSCTDRGVHMVRPDDELPRGAILLAEATDSSWTPAFMRAGAIVLERGGPLSHAAILARELGVPAVLNVGTSVRSLAGRLLTVDGTSGIVVVHDEPLDPTDDISTTRRTR